MRKQRHRRPQHVSFSSEAADRPTSRVTVTEDRNDVAFLDPLGRPVTADDVAAATCTSPSVGSVAGRDSLAVLLGMLRCGFRYAVTVRLPDLPPDEGGTVMAADASEEEAAATAAVVVGPCLDPDLTAEVVWERKGESVQANSNGSGQSVRIALSARRPGRYRAHFVLERRLTPPRGASAGPKSFLTSVEVEATLMRKDQGTPQLREDVERLGKLAGYDSDEETEWQGFD